MIAVAAIGVAWRGTRATDRPLMRLSVDLGPDAVVRGDVAVIGGSLNRSPGARIDGKVDNVAFGAPFPFGRRFGRDSRPPMPNTERVQRPTFL